MEPEPAIFTQHSPSGTTHLSPQIHLLQLGPVLVHAQIHSQPILRLQQLLILTVLLRPLGHHPSPSKDQTASIVSLILVSEICWFALTVSVVVDGTPPHRRHSPGHAIPPQGGKDSCANTNANEGALAIHASTRVVESNETDRPWTHSMAELADRMTRTDILDMRLHSLEQIFMEQINSLQKEINALKKCHHHNAPNGFVGKDEEPNRLIEPAPGTYVFLRYDHSLSLCIN